MNNKKKRILVIQNIIYTRYTEKKYIAWRNIKRKFSKKIEPNWRKNQPVPAYLLRLILTDEYSSKYLAIVAFVVFILAFFFYLDAQRRLTAIDWRQSKSNLKFALTQPN